MTDILALPEVRFTPRRLGHVNLAVGDLQRSFDFYHHICGLELGFDEVDLQARFLTNGNSHHDVALMQASDQELVGRDGQVQKRAEDWPVPGLNHLAFEMPTERTLVEAIARAEAAGTTMYSFYDHLISRSVYLPDPDRIELEFYTDATKDFRSLYASLGEGLLSAHWEPALVTDPDETPRYIEDGELDHRPTPDALARPLRTCGATIVVEDLATSIGFYRQVAGLQVLESDLQQWQYAVMGGTAGYPDLLMLGRQDGQSPGFHHFSLDLGSPAEVEATEARLRAAGVPVERTVRTPRKTSVVILDPDGTPVELAATLPDTCPYRSFASADNRSYLA